MGTLAFTREAAFVLLAVLSLVGCQGQIGGAAGADARTDGSAVADGGAIIPQGSCALTPALELFATRCTSAGCHGAGGQFPDLTAVGVRSGLVDQMSRAAPTRRLVTRGDPASSWLYAKMAGTQGAGGGALMPLGTSTPIAEASVLEAWIRAGAPTECDGGADAGVHEPSHPDPNALDQAALFTCRPAPASSVARIRRIDRVEWTHAVGESLNSTAARNPFNPPESLPYSTYAQEVTIDPATLDLNLLVLPEAPANWTSRNAVRTAEFPAGVPTYPVNNDPQLACIYTDVAPSAACIDYFVDRFLTVGVLSRAPTAGERARLRAFLVEGLAAERGDITLRRRTLADVGQAAWLTAGALFRSELGEPVAADPASRRRLTNDELALALAGTLSTHRPGSPLRIGTPRPGDPDWATPERGWLQQIRRAADDGSIQDPAVMRRLIETYRGGVDPERRDLELEVPDVTRRQARGEYWLAPRIAGFFREWLGYSAARTVFKDTPARTSRFDDYTGNPQYNRTTRAYEALQDPGRLYEADIAQQLDDTIARTIIDSAARREDPFRALMTTRLWRLPSNTDARDPTYARLARVYNIDTVIPATREGRWVELPAAERRGVLTHPAWLAAYGGNFEDDASIVHRGRWVRENLFCQSVPGLELVMVEATLVASAADRSARDRVVASIETSAQAATCMGCHRLMNSLGYPFEVYNHAGFVRAIDHGRPPDGRSTVTNAPDPALNRAFADAIEFAEAVAGSPHARRCFIRQAFRYFAGRDETLADACTLAAMEAALASGSFFDMLGALVTSDTFRYRTIDAGAR